MFEAIFLSLFIAAWLFLGFIPWLAFSVATRGNAGLAYLPLSMFAGVVAGMAVPILGADDAAGIWWSMLAAAAVPALLLGVKQFSLGARASVRPARIQESGPE